MQPITFRAMGSQILIALDSDSEALLNQAWQARDWFMEWEEVFSRFSITSELSILNRQSGIPQKVSRILMEILTLALQVQEQTNNLVNPLILNDLENAGYDLTFEKLGENLSEILRRPNFPLPLMDAKIEIDEANQLVSIPQGYRIDLGGVAKGWAAHQTMLRLQNTAPVLVDAGGDIAISAPMSNGEAWPVGIANPFIPTENTDLVMLNAGGIATSGRDYRRWQVNGQWQHHIIDPRLNAPAQTDIISVCVIAEDVMAAEAAAKTALIMGSRDGSSWMDHHPNLDYLIFLESGETLASSGFHNYLWNELWQDSATIK